MGVVGPGNYWDGVVANEEFESMLSILDFPMESLEGDGFVEDWDASNSQCLGPIMFDTLMAQPVIPHEKFNTQSPNLLATNNIAAAWADRNGGKKGGRRISADRIQQSQLRLKILYHTTLFVLDDDHSSLVIKSKAAEVDGTTVQKQLRNDVKESSSSHVSPKFTSEHRTLRDAHVLESSGSSSTAKSLPIKSSIKVPVRTRSKRVRPLGINPWCLISPFSATTSPSKRTSNFMKNDERRSKPSRQSVSAQTPKIRLNCQAAATKKCSHCEITKTPQWREGPMGPKTLCNACGVRYRSGRLFPEYRPAASPTFVPSLHSNSHRKVIEMRYKVKDVRLKVKNPKDPESGIYSHE